MCKWKDKSPLTVSLSLPYELITSDDPMKRLRKAALPQEAVVEDRISLFYR